LPVLDIAMIKRKSINKLLIGIGGFVIALALGEILLKITNIDTKMLWNSLYTVEGDFKYVDKKEIYRPSKNWERIYELIPNGGVECTNCTHHQEPLYDTITITVNSHGLRGDETDFIKPDSIFRIAMLGGSTTYGASVSDEHTYSVRLQNKLNETGTTKFEVLNCGLNAYVNSQKAAYAEEVIQRFSPDLVIIETINNGRRAFFYNDEQFFSFFKRNKSLYLENIPMPLSDNAFINRIHKFLIPRSRIYRLLMVASNNRYIQHWTKHHNEQHGRGYEVLHKNYDEFADEYGREALLRLFKKYPDIIFVLHNPLGWKRDHHGVDQPPNVHRFIIDSEGKPSEYRDMHPPSYVYGWFADELMGFLLRAKLIPDAS
jgi:hypothetical protein